MYAALAFFVAVFLAQQVEGAKINAVLGSTISNDVEWIEITGTANENIGALTLIVVESDDNTADVGKIDNSVDLTGLTLGCNGYLAIGNDLAVTNFPSVTFSLTVGANFIENSAYTIALVQTSTIAGQFVQNSTLTVSDKILVSDGNFTDIMSASLIIPADNGFTPAGFRRIPRGSNTYEYLVFDPANDPANVPNFKVTTCAPTSAPTSPCPCTRFQIICKILNRKVCF